MDGQMHRAADLCELLWLSFHGGRLHPQLDRGFPDGAAAWELRDNLIQEAQEDRSTTSTGTNVLK